MPLQAKRVAGETVEILDSLLLTTMHQLGLYEVVSKEDVRAVLGLDRLQALVGCDDTACGSEIAGAVDAQMLVTGTVGQLGDELVIVMNVIDPVNAQALNRKERRVKAAESLYASAIERTVLELLDLNISESDWSRYLAYRRGASRSATAAVDITSWKRQVSPRQQDWIDYFGYRTQQLDKGEDTLDFVTWLEWEETRSSFRLAALVQLGVACATGVGGGLFLARARQDAEAADELYDGYQSARVPDAAGSAWDEYDGKRRSANRIGWTAIALGGVTVALITSSLVTWLAAPDEPQTDVTAGEGSGLSFAPSPSGFGLTWRAAW